VRPSWTKASTPGPARPSRAAQGPRDIRAAQPRHCRERNSQFANSWGAFIEAERRTRGSNDPAQQAINDLARERFAAIEPRLSYLTVNVPDATTVTLTPTFGPSHSGLAVVGTF
jgi:hypothetical protein